MSKSAKSARSPKGKAGGEPSKKEKSYKLWIITYHGNGLKPIRDEFIKRVTDGLRRNVFVVDLDAEPKQPQELSTGSSFLLKKKNKTPLKSGKIDVKKVDLLTKVLGHIASCLKEYDYVTETIEREKRFDLLEYWKRDLPLPVVVSDVQKGAAKGTKKGAPAATAKGGGEKTAKGGAGGEKTPRGGEKAAKGGGKTGKLTAKAPVVEELTFPECPSPLAPKVHNKVGNPMALSKRKYIEDFPEHSKIYIVLLLTDQASAKKLYTDLLSRSEPVQAIIHYLPQESAYDILLPTKNVKEFLMDTWNEIQKSIYQLRQISLLKPVGMFQQQLPVISVCLAAKLTHQIFDELTWYLYDLELLYQHYKRYYFEDFHLTNVAMDANVNIAESRQYAESLSIQGHFLQTPMPAMVNDLATIATYLESLLSTVEKPANLLNELDMLLLSTPSHRSISGSYTARVISLLQTYRNAFLSITRVKRYNRLIVDNSNKLLHYLVSYTNLNYFRYIYHCCLEYNILRDIVINSNLLNCLTINNPLEVELIPFYFPQYCKFIPTHDGVLQRLIKRFQKYHEYEVDIMLPGMKLYRFRRRLNEVIEQQEMIILPSRLCFRDFTLFQMEEFLENLITPEMREAIILAQMSSIDPELEIKKMEADYNIDANVFIRPNSLKARKLQAAAAAAAALPKIPSTAAQKPKGQASQKGKKKTAPAEPISVEPDNYMGLPTDHPLVKPYNLEENYCGLPPNHPLLKGYNLEDIRQEITVKSSSYYFEEGLLRLYEDRWCFSDLNKTINLKIKQCKVHLNAVRNKLERISPTIYVRSKNYIRCRLLNKQHELPKVVLNYPNGLVIHYNQEYCEQTWIPQETYNEERRRLITPDGSVIVFNKAEDVIRIMRYNGELYELFQYELEEGEEGEEEEGDDGLLEDDIDVQYDPSSVMIKSIKEVSSQKSMKAKEAKEKAKAERKLEKAKAKAEKEKEKEKEMEAAGKNKPKGKNVKGKDSGKQPSEPVPEEVSSSSSEKDSKTSIDYLKEVVENELKFLDTMMEKYCLKYVHLKMTTSVGRVLHIKQSGKIVEKGPISLVEWHDYYANESFAMRGDGVKLIWNKDELKCYYPDQTLIRTKAEDNVRTDAEIFEDIDFPISESSSHITVSLGEFLETPAVIIDDVYEILKKELEQPKNANKTREQLFDEISLKRDRQIKQINIRNQMGYGQEDLEGEDYTRYLTKHMEEEEKDTEYVVFQGQDYYAYQEHYATVHFTLLCDNVLINSIETELIAADGIYVQVVPDNIFEKEKEIEEVRASVNDGRVSLNDGVEIPVPVPHVQKLPSILKHLSVTGITSGLLNKDTEEPLQSGQPEEKKFVVKIRVGNDVSFKITEEICRIEANMERHDTEYGLVPDTLQLKFNFDDQFVGIFKNFMESIAEFKNYSKPICKERIFLEVDNAKTCNVQGFDFVDNIPHPTDAYSYSASNTVTILSPLHTMMDMMVIKSETHAADMKKFPRFPKRISRRSIAESYPRVASCNIYIKIPKQLTHSDDIEKFIEPLDKFTFKRMRRQMRENIVFHIKPQIRIEMQRLTSRNSWKKRQIFHKCRLLSEMQRKGLYHAMLKHNSFPNYQKFRDHFDFHVRHIEFFDFMMDKCSEEAVRRKKENEALAEERRSKNFTQKLQ